MSQAIANVNPSLDTFDTWLEKTNQGLFAISTVVVTTAANTVGATTSGNVFIQGVLAANIAGFSEIRGGTVDASANLVVSSNLISNGALSTFNSNAVFVGANTRFNSNTTTVAGNNFAVSSVSTFSNNATFSAPASFSANVTLTGGLLSVSSNVALAAANVTISGGFANVISTAFFRANVSVLGTELIIGANTTVNGSLNVNTAPTIVGQATFNANAIPSANGGNLGTSTRRWQVSANNVDTITFSSNTVTSNTVNLGTIGEYRTVSTTLAATTGSPLVILQLPIATYRAGTVNIQTKAGSDYQLTTLSYLHSDTDVSYTTSGTLYTNNQVFTADAALNGANVDIRVTQTVGSQVLKAVVELIK